MFFLGCNMSLAFLADVKAQLKIPAATTTNDALLSSMLNAASAAIENYCKRQFSTSTRVEFYSGDGSQTLLLRNTPVQSVGGVWLDDTGYFGAGADPFATATLLVAGTDYALAADNDSDPEVSASGILRRINNVWPAVWQRAPGMLIPTVAPGIGNIRVEYVSGYSAIPADLRQACAQFAAQMFRTRDPSLSQEAYEDYSYTRGAAADQLATFGTVVSLLKPYKRWVL